LIVFVAFVIASSVRIVLSPRAQTHPAELVTTASYFFAASHVVAALVLFDGFAAVGTLLCVGEDPPDVFAFS
jgi:hypothetical protein